MEETGDLLGNSEKNKECAETELELFKEQTWNEDIERRGGGAITKRMEGKGHFAQILIGELLDHRGAGKLLKSAG